MKVGSLFTGIGGFDLAFERAGVRAAWQVEIDPACNLVLQRHWPEVPRFDDITTIDPGELPRVDVLCGGFPCQDLSVAGRRAGLAGRRSSLFWEFHRIAAALAPPWVLIENVPGLYSSHSVEDEATADEGDSDELAVRGWLESSDFGTILEALVELGYGVAWRCLDAQNFGLAQRRARVFLVGYLGTPWSTPAQVLFEPESVYGDTPSRREAGTDLASTLGGGSGSRGWSSDTERITFVPEVSVSRLTAANHFDPSMETYVVHNGQGNPNWDRDRSLTLDTQSPPAVYQVIAGGGGSNPTVDVERAPTLSSLRDNPTAVAFADPRRHDERHGGLLREHPSLNASNNDLLHHGVTVRRLTPLECERLQGFPDGWTAGERDSARYRMLGNAVAVPVVEWIARRLLQVATP